MKTKNYFSLLFAMMFSLHSFSQGGLLPNSSFENWTTNTIYENPDIWITSNFREGGNFSSLFKSTDAQDQNYSVLLRNIPFFNGQQQDTAFAYCALGEVGNDGPSAGIPYAADVDLINGYYKGTIGAGDSAFVMVIKFNSGTIVGMDMLPITVSQNNWTPFSFPISPVSQDSIFLGFISTNPSVQPHHASPNTSVYFDNISLSNSITGPGPALPNHSFESWIQISSTTPDNWTTLNDFLTSSGMTAVTESSDAYTGTSAAKLETLNFYNDTIPGLLIYGNLVIGYQPTPVPYSATPTTFSGAYQYFPSGADNGFISFQFYSNGNNIGGNMINMNSSSVYVPFSVNTNLSGTPDSVLVACFSGENPGSYAIVDDLQFSGGNVDVIEYPDFDFSFYPNPSRNNLTITGNMVGEYQVLISDVNGKIFLSEQKSGNQTNMDVSGLPSGVYYLTIDTEGKRLSRFMVVEK